MKRKRPPKKANIFTNIFQAIHSVKKEVDKGIASNKKQMRLADINALKQKGTPNAIRRLGEIACYAEKEVYRQAALSALEARASKGDTEAQETLCFLVIAHDHKEARTIVLSEQYIPKDPQQQALFYFLTAQWTNYEALDFTHTLLQQGYNKASPNLQKRLLVQAKKAGRIEWMTVISTSQQKQQDRLTIMTDAEWTATLTVLKTHKQWSKAWHLTKIAPWVWALRLIQLLDLSQWQPDNPAEAMLCKALIEQARQCSHNPPDTSRLLDVDKTWQPGTLKHRATTISYAGDLAAIVTTNPSRRIVVYRLSDEKQLHTFSVSFRAAGLTLAFSPDGRVLYCGGGSYKEAWVERWQMPSGVPMPPITGDKFRVSHVVPTPDGKELITATTKGHISWWQLPKGERIRLVQENRSSLNCLGVHFEDDLLVNTQFHTLYLQQFSTGQVIKTVYAHKDQIDALAISPDASLLATGGKDKVVHVWQRPACVRLASIPKPLSYNIKDLYFSADGHSLISIWKTDNSALGDAIRLMHLSDRPTLLSDYQHYTPAKRNVDLSLSPDKQYLVSQQGKNVRVWPLRYLSLPYLPPKDITLDDIKTLRQLQWSAKEDAWLAFLWTLQARQRQFDIDIEEIYRATDSSNFDIELD